MANKELIDELNKSMNLELSTIIRYLLQSSMIEGRSNQPLRELYRAEVADELGHAQYLADKIVSLGGTPIAAPDVTPPPKDVETMVKNDIEAEKGDVAQYKKIADMADAAGDIELKLQMEDQAADESRHAQELHRMLKE